MADGLTEEEKSKDQFFRRIAQIGEEMTMAHGKDFATGAFVLAARWITDGRIGKPVERPN
jgi:hypothetical protein